MTSPLIHTSQARHLCNKTTQKPSGHCVSLFHELPNSWRNFFLFTYISIFFHTNVQHYVLLLKVCLSSVSLQKITAFQYILFWGGVVVWVGWSVWFLCGGGRLCGGILVVWLWCILKESRCLFPLCLAALPEFSPLPPPSERSSPSTPSLSRLSHASKKQGTWSTRTAFHCVWLHLLPQMDMKDTTVQTAYLAFCSILDSLH